VNVAEVAFIKQTNRQPHGTRIICRVLKRGYSKNLWVRLNEARVLQTEIYSKYTKYKVPE
jgi:hypothetical protein